MLILATADLHGHLPKIPECDILLIGGDVCPVQGSHKSHIQATWMTKFFREWLESVPAKHIVGIGGNHDFVLEDVDEKRKIADLPWTYLQDEEVTIDGVRIWGSPWVPNLPRWAFHGGMNSAVIEGTVKNIPKGLDILLSHGPMDGYGDVVGPQYGGPTHVGCLNMADHVKTIKPRAFVCGHIHEGRGHYRHKHIEQGIFNVSHMDEMYVPNGPLVEIPI